jgi:hypothetical protein
VWRWGGLQGPLASCHWLAFGLRQMQSLRLHWERACMHGPPRSPALGAPPHSPPRPATPAATAQGYGLTETCAASFIATPYKFEQLGAVGPPMGHTELRLEAVPEMGYDPLANPPRGEVRGCGVVA